MKVLIVCDKETISNPYVKTLAEGISSQNVDIKCSLHDFWQGWDSYDIIHVQWPHLLLLDHHSVEQIREQLIKIKQLGKQIVVTCHNFSPHYNNDRERVGSYNIVYDLADCFIHLGSFSYNVFKKRYPNAKHFIIPHHVYDRMYTELPTRKEAIERLRLDERKRYILCFGAFRHDEERNIAVLASKVCGRLNYEVLAPAFSKYTLRKRFWITLKQYIRYVYRRVRYRDIICLGKYVSDEDLPYYYAACDIALIHRKKILNSGNLPMAFYMGKVTVGPNVGNVGAILKETNNPTFDVEHVESVPMAIKRAIELFNKSNKGEENRRYAFNYLLTSIVADKHVRLYSELLNDNTLRSRLTDDDDETCS